jgi:hypothetical protein
MIDPLQGSYPPFVISDKVNELIDASNRQEKAIIMCAEVTEDGNYVDAKRLIMQILYGTNN